MTEIDRTIPFVETHHHLWELGRLPYRWLEEPGDPDEAATLGDYRRIRADWGPDRFFREFYGQNVVKSIHVEAAMSGPDPVVETAWLADVHRAYGKPNGLVVFCDLAASGVEATIDRHLAASDLVRGVRIRQHPDDGADHGLRRGLEAAERHGLSYELNAAPGRLLSGRDTARAHPDLKVIVGHAGLPLQRDPEYFKAWAAEIDALAELDNVACKISGLGMADHTWTIDSIRPWVLHCIEAFGLDRSMFGTNWPVDSLYATYHEQVDAYRIILAAAGFSRDEQARLLHGNAERHYAI